MSHLRKPWSWAEAEGVVRESVQDLCSESVKGLPCLGLDHCFFLVRPKARRALGVREDRPSGQCCCHPENR